jgi:hypothetical protein
MIQDIKGNFPLLNTDLKILFNNEWMENLNAFRTCA